jgi:osmotically-inducible protein OsmY
MYWWSYPEWYNGLAYRGSQRGRDAAWASSRSAENAFRASAERRLTLRVAAALLNDPAVTGGSVEVSAQHGVVILDGDIDTEGSHAAASQRVRTVPGVADVCNALTVTYPRRQAH